MIFVKILGLRVRMLNVRYSSHFVNLFFFGNINNKRCLKSSGIFLVVYMLLIKQYKVCFVSSSTACNNSSAMLSTPMIFFISIHLFPFQIQILLLVSPVLRGNLLFFSSSSNKSESLYNSSTYCCHISVLSLPSIRVFPSFYLDFPKIFLIRLYIFSVLPRSSWFSMFSQYFPRHSSLSFLTFS